MRKLLGAVALFALLPAVSNAQMTWRSSETPRTEWAVIDCVNDHKSSWGSSCGFEAATFIDTCQKEEGLSEAACTQIIKRDIFAFIQG